MSLRPVWWLVWATLLVGCQSNPAPIQPFSQPSNLADRVVQAQKAFDEDRLVQAWVSLVNAPESTPEQLKLLVATEDRLKQRNLLPFALAPTLTSAPVSFSSSGPSDWLKGTVTVLVNKGLRLENGVAIPDVVIGSGFFIDATGLLVTNYHVIEAEVVPGSTQPIRVSVRLAGSKGERLPAKVVGWDKNHDLALLKAELRPEYFFSLAPEGVLIPGQRLQALGSPGGLESTLTEGIVSALKRPLLPMGDVYQMDVAVNPGNSGGPLVNAQGQVVGVVFAGIQEFQGVNFAIPSQLLKKMLPRLQLGGRAEIPWLALGLQEDMRGLEVIYVLPRGPADWAGIRPGDRLVSLGNTPVAEIAAAQARILDFLPETAVEIGLVRDGKPLTLWSSLASRPDDPLKVAFDSDLAGRVLSVAFGVIADDLGTPVDRNFRVKRVLANSDGEALQLGIDDPFRILEWSVDTERDVLICRLVVKRRVGGYFEAQVILEAPFGLRLFL